MIEVLLSVGTTWDDELLIELAHLNEDFAQSGTVFQVYGSLPNDVVGSVREAFRLPDISISDVRRHCKLATSLSIHVNYTMNSTVITPSFVAENLQNICAFLDELMDCGISGITVASSLLVKMIREKYPNLPISVSTACNITSIPQIRYLVDLGVNTVNLDLRCNRDFELLSNVVSLGLACNVQLLVNETCLLLCPMRIEHFNIQSLARTNSRISSHELSRTQMYDYYYSECSARLLSPQSFPMEILRARWIRPEDIQTYEKVGIKYFKITGRTMPSKWLASVTRQYLTRQHRGNLLDLFPIVQDTIENEGKKTPDAIIHNSALNSFLQYFIHNRPRCDSTCGVTCFYCYEFAEKLRNDGFARVSPLPNNWPQKGAI